MTEKKRPEKRGDVQTEEARKNDVLTEHRIQEENPQGIEVASAATGNKKRGVDGDNERSRERGGEESRHGRKQKGNQVPD